MSATVIVTGGSRGIGAATCRLAARAGWSVLVNYQSNRAAADAIVAAIRTNGGIALPYQANVTQEKLY